MQTGISIPEQPVTADTPGLIPRRRGRRHDMSNTVPYLSTLPTEILTQIFGYNFLYGYSYTNQFNLREALRLSLVCRLFHAIITRFRCLRCHVGLYTYKLDTDTYYSYPHAIFEGYVIGFLRFGVYYNLKSSKTTRNILELHRAYGESIKYVLAVFSVSAYIPNTAVSLIGTYLKFTHLEKLLYTIDTPLGPRGPEIDRPARDEYLTTGPCTPAFSIQFTELFPNLTTIEFQDAYPESPNRTEPSFNPDYLLPSLVNILSSCYSLKHLKIHLAVDLALPLLTTRKIESMLPMSNSPVKLQTLTLQVRLVQRLYGIRPFHGIWLLDALAYLLPIEGNTLESLDFNVSRKCPTNNWIYAGDAEDIEEYVAVRQVAFVEKHNRLNRRIKLPAIRHLKISAEKESPFVFLAFTNIDRKSLKELDLEDINGKRHSAGADQFKCEIQFIKILLNMFPTIHTLRLNQRGPQYLKLNEYLMPEIASLIMNIKTVILYSVFPANEPRDNFLEMFGEDWGRSVEFQDLGVKAYIRGTLRVQRVKLQLRSPVL
ncbi:hypothetical protein TWF788_010336 [Orbilia oligospora]|uniref:F-box domain-containing protein n=1 Tax=Orbilia oligospora TaxID=2813651 RepID=A0A7C8KDJ9_ORBOL|nr:hypothetical protein TWF788_010336 [Orbilia oligospora]